MTKKEYITNAEQLERWVAGEPVHRLMANGGGECCPDFSCCHPALLADEVTRKAFAAANDDARMGFLGHFLGAALAAAFSDSEPGNIHITGVTLDPTHEPS